MKNELPVSTTQIPLDQALKNHDGTDAVILEFGIVKRTVKLQSGQTGFQYLDPNFYVIPDYRKYLRYRRQENRRTAARQISDQYNTQETRNQNEVAVSQDIKISETVAPHERLDRAIDRSLRTGEMIKLDEAFPDVGVYESDPTNPDRKLLPTSPAIRARQAALHGHRYQKEYILRTVHRLALRRVPVDQIAQMFNVEVITVYNWLDELRARLKSEASTMTITQIAGDTLSFYNEARALGLTIASTADKTPDKVRGMEVALKAEQDKHKFLQVAGFYDTAKLGRETMEDEAAKKARAIINMTKNLLSGKFEVDEQQDIADQISLDDKVLL